MVVLAEEDLVNHGRTPSRNGQASRSRSLLRIEDDTGRWAVIGADVSVGVPPTTPWRHEY